MEKNYKLELLYDNGIIETFDTGKITIETLEGILNVFYHSFHKGADAVIQTPNGKGYNAYINITKVTRVSVLD